MKHTSLLLLILAGIFLCSCNKNPSGQLLLNANNLKSTFILLHPDSSYTLKTPKGAIIKIAKNSFDIRSNEKISLEIKEAYSAGDILLAGLATKSNGRLLQSGGMIYLNATANDKAVTIKKTISISIPSEVYDGKMQLFKGKVEDDSSINWIDPQPLDTAPAAKKIISGELLFKANCASCHKPTMDFTGPSLRGWRARVPGGDWIYKYIANPSAMQETDPYARFIFRKWNKTQMTAFPTLGKKEVDAIMAYVDNEALLNPGPINNTSKTDSSINEPPVTTCSDSILSPLPDTSIQVLPIDTMPDSTGIMLSEAQMAALPMYQFNIDQSGWYNVDCFIENNRDSVTNVNLTAVLKMPGNLNAEVYLCIPDRKLLANGYEMQNGKYTFYENNGVIPLIPGDEAIIFALGSDSAKAYYGITRFKVQDKQNILVNLKASTQEEILSAIKSNKLDGVKIEIDKPETYIREYPLTDSLAKDTTIQKMQMQIFEVPCTATDSIMLVASFKK